MKEDRNSNWRAASFADGNPRRERTT